MNSDPDLPLLLTTLSTESRPLPRGACPSSFSLLPSSPGWSNPPWPSLASQTCQRPSSGSCPRTFCLKHLSFRSTSEGCPFYTLRSDLPFQLIRKKTHCTETVSLSFFLRIPVSEIIIFKSLHYFDFFNWSIVGLQCCVSFRCTTKWFSYIWISVSTSIYLYMYVYTFFFRFFSHVSYYRMLNTIPRAIQWVLVVYLFYIRWWAYGNPILLIYPYPPFFFGN